MISLEIGPQMDGHEIARMQRKDDALSGMLLIAPSRYGQEEDRHFSPDLGMGHLLTQPIDAKTFAELISVAG